MTNPLDHHIGEPWEETRSAKELRAEVARLKAENKTLSETYSRCLQSLDEAHAYSDGVNDDLAKAETENARLRKAMERAISTEAVASHWEKSTTHLLRHKLQVIVMSLRAALSPQTNSPPTGESE